MAEEDVGEIHDTGEHRHEARTRRRQQHGAHRDQRYVQRGEVALRPPRDVHDGGHECDVEQHLAVQEGHAGRVAPEVGVPVRSQRHDDRRYQEERCNQDVRRCRDLELQRGAEVDRDRDTHPPT